jgi:hypothetical protein
MSISIVGTPQTGTALNGGNVTLTFDTSVTIKQNDVVLLYGGHYYREGADLGPSTEGYVEIFANDESEPAFGAWYKIMGATPDASVSCYGSGNAEDGTAYAAYVLRGVDTEDVIDVAPVITGPQAFGWMEAPKVTLISEMSTVVALGCGMNYDEEIGTLDDYMGYTGLSAGVDETKPICIAGSLINYAWAFGDTTAFKWRKWWNASKKGITATFILNRKIEDDAKRYWVGGEGNWMDDTNHWATESGGTPAFGNLPDDQTDAIFDENSFEEEGETVTVDALYRSSTYVPTYINVLPNLCKTLDFSDVTKNPILSVVIAGGETAQLVLGGSIILSEDMTLSGEGIVELIGNGTYTIDTKGVESDFTYRVGFVADSFGNRDSRYELASNLNCKELNTYYYTSVYPNTSCTFKSAIYDINAESVSFGGVDNLGSSTITVTSNFVIAAGEVSRFNAATSTVVLNQQGLTDEDFLSANLGIYGFKLHNVKVVGTGEPGISFLYYAEIDRFECLVPANLVFAGREIGVSRDWEFTEFVVYGTSVKKTKVTGYPEPSGVNFIRI